MRRTRAGAERSTVSIVVATHRRPDALAAALRSVLAQDHAEWELFVIGDGCDERTAAVVAELDDARARYVDLPARFGEQSGPNSVGLALARGDLVAFLNHDDLWTCDHLSRALRGLDEGEGAFFVARSACSETVAPAGDGGSRAVFTHLAPRTRDAGDAFVRRHDLLEPCSAWVVRAELARAVGPWRPARELFRTPLQDWLLRAWRRGARFVFGEEVTVLHVGTHRHRTGDPGGTYGAASPEHAWLEALLRRGAEAVRSAVAEDLARHGEAPRRGPSNPLDRLFAGRATRELYRRTGFDALELFLRLRGRRRGRLLEGETRRRTGAELPPPPDLAAVLRSLAARAPGESAPTGE